jgi:hypothetical protein
MWPEARVQSFRAFSERLTGFDALRPELARAHLGRASVSELGCGGALVELLDRWDQAVAANTTGAFNEVIGTQDELCKSLIFLWYTSTWPLPNPGNPLLLSARVDVADDDPAITLQALMWTAISAHPPMLTGGYFGYWRYPPES